MFDSVDAPSLRVAFLDARRFGVPIEEVLTPTDAAPVAVRAIL